MSQISHSYYAAKHGYGYRRIITKDWLPAGYAGHWSKAYALDALINDPMIEYDWIVLTDLDVLFMDMEASLEAKLTEWNPSASIFMSEDPPGNPSNYLTPNGSTTKVLNINTGFQIWKITSETKKFIRLWKTSSETFCKEYQNKGHVEQDCWNIYIRDMLPTGKLNIAL